jgi:hypothetical protein
VGEGQSRQMSFGGGKPKGRGTGGVRYRFPTWCQDGGRQRGVAAPPAVPQAADACPGAGCGRLVCGQAAWRFGWAAVRMGGG